MKNISQYILEYLQQKQRVTIPGFGDFHTESFGAQLNNENKSILPPSQLVCYTQNYQATENSFVIYLAEQKNISEQKALHELQTQTDFWKKKMAAREEFSIPELGSFKRAEKQLIFTGERLAADDPAFFGLEEIKFSEIQNKKSAIHVPQAEPAKNYTFSKNFIWILLVIIPLVVLAYFAFTNKELIFGKKSFDDDSLNKSEIKTKQTPVEVQSPVLDSIQVDSLITAP